MKYPRLSPELDRRRKLMPDDIRDIRLERERGRTLKYLAKKFNVTIIAIFYWTNENYRQKILERSKHQNKNRKTQNKYHQESKKYIRNVNPAFKEYQKEQSKKHYNKHKNESKTKNNIN